MNSEEVPSLERTTKRCECVGFAEQKRLRGNESVLSLTHLRRWESGSVAGARKCGRMPSRPSDATARQRLIRDDVLFQYPVQSI